MVSHLGLKGILLIAFVYVATQAKAIEKDSIRHWGFTVSVMKSEIIALDKNQRKYLKKKENGSVALELNHINLPSDHDSYAKDFNYPSLSIGLRYTMNNRVRFHRTLDLAWDKIEEVPYDSRLGNTLSLYGTFQRAIHRNKHWETSYSLSGGIGYTNKWYNKDNNIDNDFIGTPILIYFGAGIHQTYRFAREWGVRASLEFVHHSNGALYRPNKGSNCVGPSVGIVYYPYYETFIREHGSFQSAPFKKFLYLDLTVGIGAKTLVEDWQITQFRTPKTDPNYRTGDFKRYATYSLQANLMYRYARRWASGIGIDAFYNTYAPHIEQLEQKEGNNIDCKPWSFGIAGKHETFFHNLSVNVALGTYLYRRMGSIDRELGGRIYERIGVNYSFPSLNGLKLGINVKAHTTKADFTELVITYPFRL
ncbi:lipid A 3-O-deacylase [Prevotella intermedia]|uniref:Lipid A 3-O-deacylase n=2 Tax=Prevotella intermedia TaxID=28131 RepID=A0AAJ3RQJ4_PREIN|nr:acyloxyacyl hydrolase [Prevotella intermedia]ATV56245.1 lipid A 3-O-deacylase [Prevotella intermedia]PJI19289.1 lipid A 3-O-deacylase [Prevotella intermedia]